MTGWMRTVAAGLTIALLVQPALVFAQEQQSDDDAEKPTEPQAPQPTANAEAQAKVAYARGGDAFKLGHYSEAIQYFEDAYRLSHKAEILFNIGLANRKEYGLDSKPEYLRRALDIYKQFLRLAQDDSERRAARQSISEVADELAAIDERERMQRLRSGSGPPQLQAALRLDAEHKPADALAQLEALLHKGGNSAPVLQDLYRLEGEIGAEAGQNSISVEAYKRLLVLSTGFELPRTAAPAAQRNLARAQKFWADRTFAISPVVPPPAEPDKPLAIPVVVENDVLSMVSRVTVFYRRSGDKRFSTVTRVGPGDVSIPAVALPAEDAEYRMEYFVQATDQYTNVVATIGGETAPLSFPVLTVEEVKKLYQKATPWYASWWFVTAASLVAAGAAVGIADAAGAFQPGPPSATYKQTIVLMNSGAMLHR